MRQDDADLSVRLATSIRNAFEQEDEPMIEAQQQEIGGVDLMSLHPVLLGPDGPAVRARRLLASLIEAESSGRTGQTAARRAEVA